mmetsp:Transcript_39/g.337  ORF Transcript_39/g.337 Transcript_39/m.337 type:complete len:307 (-) Transcript_39:2323-3243(-)
MIDTQLLQHDVGVLFVGVGEDVLLRRDAFEHCAESFVSLDHLLVGQLPMHVVVPIVPVDVVTMRCQSGCRRAMFHVQLHAQTRHVSCWDAQLALHVRTNVVPNVLCNLGLAIQGVVQIHEQDVHSFEALLHRCGGAHVVEFVERTSLHGRARVSVQVERSAKLDGKQDPTRKGRHRGNRSDVIVDAKFKNPPSMKERKAQGAPAGEASRTKAEEGARWTAAPDCKTSPSKVMSLGEGREVSAMRLQTLPGLVVNGGLASTMCVVQLNATYRSCSSVARIENAKKLPKLPDSGPSGHEQASPSQLGG